MPSRFRNDWREDFAGDALNTNDWEVVKQGAGQTVVVASSELRLTSGTTAGEEVIVRSKRAFQIPMALDIVAKASQKIANVNCVIEVVDETDATNFVRLAWDGSNTTMTTTSQCSTGNHTGAGTVAQITSATAITTLSRWQKILLLEEAWVMNYGLDVTTVAVAAAKRNLRILDPTRRYRIQFRITNGGTNPSSSTTFTIDSVLMTEHEAESEARLALEGVNVSGLAKPVYVQNNVYVYTTNLKAADVTGTIAASTAKQTTAFDMGSGTTRAYQRVRAWVSLYRKSTTGAQNRLRIEQCADQTATAVTGTLSSVDNTGTGGVKSATFTATTGTPFVAGDVGKAFSNTANPSKIPANAYIATFTSSTVVTIKWISGSATAFTAEACQMNHPWVLTADVPAEPTTDGTPQFFEVEGKPYLRYVRAYVLNGDVAQIEATRLGADLLSVS